MACSHRKGRKGVVESGLYVFDRSCFFHSKMRSFFMFSLALDWREAEGGSEEGK